MPQLVAIGLLAGVFSSLFGVGGGIVIVPLLLFTGRFTERPAMATSLAAIGITAAYGTIRYATKGAVQPLEAVVVGLPATGGAVLGASLQQRIPTRRLSYLFALVLAAIASELLYKAAGRYPRRGVDHTHLTTWPIVAALLIGVLAGVVAGLFGVGGGILFVPVLSLLLGLSQLHAEATSLLAILPTVAAGVWRQRSYGNVRWQPALLIGLASVGGGEAGVQIATSLPDGALKILFATLVVFVAAQIALRARRLGRREQPA